jgi:hypothetical protein
MPGNMRDAQTQIDNSGNLALSQKGFRAFQDVMTNGHGSLSDQEDQKNRPN